MFVARFILTNTLLGVCCLSTGVLAVESSLYASLRQSVLYTDSGEMNSSEDIGIVDQGSRVGIQGNRSFGQFNGFGRVELGIDASEQNATPGVRLGYVGVSGDFGIVSVGSQSSAWETYIGASHTNFVDEGSWQNGPVRNDSTLKYAGRIDQVSIEVDALLASETANEDGQPANRGMLDEMQVAVGYSSGNVTINAALIERDGGADGYLGGGSLFGAKVSYDAGPLSLSLALAQDDKAFGSDTATEQTTGMKLKASYVSGTNSFLAVVTTADNEAAATKPLGVALGYQHDLSQHSRVALEMSSVDPDIAGLDSSIEGGVMYRHDW